MTPDQLTTLHVEVVSDPLGLGYSALLPNSPGRVVDLLNAPTQSMLQAISASVAMEWAAAGAYASIVAASNNSASPVQSSCLVVRDVLAANLPLNMADPVLQGLFAAWVTAGVITQTQHDQLMTIATLPASRAQVLGLPTVSEAYLIAAGIEA